ncbi:hypothetical protein D9M72_638410 [compost metagenome]
MHHPVVAGGHRHGDGAAGNAGAAEDRAQPRVQQATAALRFMRGGHACLGQDLECAGSGAFDTGDDAGHPSILQ